MRRTSALVASLWLIIFPSFAQRSFNDSGAKLYNSGAMFVPNTLTELTAKTIDVDFILLSNTSGSAVTVLVQDESTNCNSSTCAWVPTVSIAANTVYVLNMPGGFRSVGVKWQAGSANAIVGQVRGATSP